MSNQEDRKMRDNPLDGAPLWAIVVILQNEAILARLEAREPKLSAEDQQTLNTIFNVARRTDKKLDTAEKS